MAENRQEGRGPSFVDPLNLIITGVGGQGNVIASQILGRAALSKGWKVTVGETFGLSQRGGPVSSHVRLSRNKNYGPLIPSNQAHIILGLEPLETLRIVPEYGNWDTVFVTNSRPIHPLNVIAGDVDYPELNWIRAMLAQAGAKLYWLDATELAVELGGPIMLNMIMLGALCEVEGFPLTGEDIGESLESVFPPSKLESNHVALTKGRGLLRNYEN